MGTTITAYYLGTLGAMTIVGLLFRCSRNCLVEARPAGTRVKLCASFKQLMPADNAMITAISMLIPVLTGEGCFSALLLSNMIAHWVKFLLEFLWIRLFHNFILTWANLLVKIIRAMYHISICAIPESAGDFSGE